MCMARLRYTADGIVVALWGEGVAGCTALFSNPPDSSKRHIIGKRFLSGFPAHIRFSLGGTIIEERACSFY